MDNSAVMKRMLETAMKAHPESFQNFDATKNVQDHLQEMVLNHWKYKKGQERITTMMVMFELFLKFIMELSNTYIRANWKASKEQLWLAFVMKERYQKIWSGTDWT